MTQLSEERIMEIIVEHCNGLNFGRIKRAIDQVLSESETAKGSASTGADPVLGDAIRKPQNGL